LPGLTWYLYLKVFKGDSTALNSNRNMIGVLKYACQFNEKCLVGIMAYGRLLGDMAWFLSINCGMHSVFT